LIVIPKEDGTRKTEYGIFLNNNGKGIGFEHVVHYDKGITSDHVIASGSFPVNFDFAKIEVESYGITHDDRSTNLETAPSNSFAINYNLDVLGGGYFSFFILNYK